MTTPYTYCITHVPSNKRYYGARFAKGCNPSDLWVTYFTSSNTIKELIYEFGKDSFKFEIRKTFSDRHSCIKWERKVLVRLGVPRNINWLNKYSGVAITPEEMKVLMVGKYGIDHASKLQSVKDKKVAKSLSKFGTKHPWLASEVRDKKDATMIERYGYANPSQVPELREKINAGITRSYETRENTVCPKCGYFCKSEANMSRYHFDNCLHYDVLPLHKEGLSPSEIEKATGLGRQSVTKYLNFFGYTGNRPKNKKVNPEARNMVGVEYNKTTYRSIENLRKFLGVGRHTVLKMIELGEVTVVKPRDCK